MTAQPIPVEFVRVGLERAENVLVLGNRLTDLTRDELLAAAANEVFAHQAFRTAFYTE